MVDHEQMILAIVGVGDVEGVIMVGFDGAKKGDVEVEVDGVDIDALVTAELED